MGQTVQKILLVDDDEATRYSMARWLSGRGYEVVIAQDCLEALGQVDAGVNVDLFLIDIVMPSGGLHGIAFGRMMRTRVPGIPTIYITGYPDLPELSEISHPLFQKPVDMDALLRAIEAGLAP